MWLKIKNFLKSRIFYLVSKEEKEYVRFNVMKNDHPVFLKMLITIFVIQFGLILYQCISSGFNFQPRDYKYIICYTALAVMCLILYPISDFYHKREKTFGYFVVVAIAILAFTIWSVAICIIDSSVFSMNGKSIVILVTYAYVLLSLSSIIILEPWVFILDSLLAFIGLNAHLAIFETKGIIVSVLVSTISIGILTSLASIINFSRRIDEINLQKEIIDLNILFKSNAYVDDLTKIYNRRYLTERIDSPLNYGNAPTGTIMLDIDNFKRVNDNYGHQNGDIILHEVGLIVKQAAIDHSESYAVRYGGEEFLLCFKHTNENELKQIAEKLRKSVEDKEFVLIDGSILHVTISLGASLAVPGINYTSLINKSDNNLYEAKGAGKNRVHFE